MDKELDAFIDNPHVVPEHSPADYIDVGELDFNNLHLIPILCRFPTQALLRRLDLPDPSD